MYWINPVGGWLTVCGTWVWWVDIIGTWTTDGVTVDEWVWWISDMLTTEFDIGTRLEMVVAVWLLWSVELLLLLLLLFEFWTWNEWITCSGMGLTDTVDVAGGGQTWWLIIGSGTLLGAFIAGSFFWERFCNETLWLKEVFLLNDRPELEFHSASSAWSGWLVRTCTL